MQFWQTLWSWLGGITSQRNAGMQYPGPTQSDSPAAPVTEETALQVSAVWACVRLLSETVASLPVTVYRGDTEITSEANWVRRLIRQPNRFQTWVEFMETMMLNLSFRGNAYARINRIDGRVVSLTPLMASQMEVAFLPDGSITYQYTQDGQVSVFAQESIWHIKLYGNGVIGMSPLAFAANSIGIALAAEKTTTKIYSNGAKPSGVLSMDRLLTAEQRQMIRENFAGLTTGTDDRLLVLEMGAKFDPVSMSPQDIELLASRRFQVEDIARWFGVPSVLINDTSGNTTWGSGIEQIVMGFYKLNLRPYLERIESSFERWLALETGYRIEFEFEGLLRTDLKSRLEGYRTGIAGSVITPNEARAIEGWPSLPGGDDLLAQINMAPVQRLGEIQNGGRDAPQITDD